MPRGCGYSVNEFYSLNGASNTRRISTASSFFRSTLTRNLSRILNAKGILRPVLTRHALQLLIDQNSDSFSVLCTFPCRQRTRKRAPNTSTDNYSPCPRDLPHAVGWSSARYTRLQNQYGLLMRSWVLPFGSSVPR